MLTFDVKRLSLWGVVWTSRTGNERVNKYLWKLCKLLMISWCITFLLLCTLWLYVARRKGPDIAVGAVAIAACVIPNWCQIRMMGDLPFEARLAGTIFALGAYVLHPKSTYPMRLGWIDCVMIGLMLLNLLSDSINEGFRFGILVRMYGEWFVPYLAGRLAFQNSRSLKELAPFGVFAAVVMGMFGVFESLTAIHPWELIYGQRTDDQVPREMIRWGLQRAWGPCEHPIYFGMAQLLYVPWVLSAWHARESSARVRFTRALSLICPLGVVSTVSRAPMLALAVFPFVWSFVTMRRMRIVFAIMAALTLIGGVLSKDYLLQSLHKFGGEKLDGTGRKIIVDGNKVEKTSVMTRFYLLQVYRRAAMRAGLVGFGTDSVLGFPIRVPVGPEDSTALRSVWAIDNTYLLLTLRFGWFAGIAFFTALILTGLAWIRRSRYFPPEQASQCIYFGAAVFAVGLGLFTVWMPQEIGFPLLLLMGGASCRQVVEQSVIDQKTNSRPTQKYSDKKAHHVQ